MSYFWDTGFTVPAGKGFSLFGPGHVLWLLFWIILCVLFGILYSKWSTKRQLACRRILAGLLLIDELFKVISTLITGRFQLDFLPFHLCSINIFLIFADAWRPADSLREILYAVCLPGAFFALIFPGWSYLPLWNGLCIHSFTAHILLFLYPFLLVYGGFRPKFTRFLKLLPLCLLTVAGVYCFNQVFGTNFMFLRYAGAGNPLSLFEAALGSPGYLVGIPILCALCWAILYGGRNLLDKVKKLV